MNAARRLGGFTVRERVSEWVLFTLMRPDAWAGLPGCRLITRHTWFIKHISPLLPIVLSLLGLFDYAL